MKEAPRLSELFQIGRNAPIRLVGILVTNLLFLLISLVITRFQGASGLGNFILAITVFNFLGIVGGLGLKQGALRYVAFFRGKNDPGRLRAVIRVSLLMGLIFSAILGGVLFCWPGSVAGFVFKKPELAPIFRILGLGLPLFSLTTILLSIIQGFKKIKLQVLAENIARPFLALLIIVLLLWGGYGMTAIAGGWVFSYLLVVLLGFFWLTRIMPPPAAAPSGWSGLKSLLAFSLPLLLVSMMHRLLVNMDVMMLGYFKPLAAVGIYGIAARLSLLIAVPLEAVDVIFAPVIAEITGRKEPEKLGELYKISTRWMSWASGAAFALLLIMASPLMELFGRNFQAGEIVLVILGIGQLTKVGVGSAGYLLAMTGHPRINLYNNAAMCLLNFLFNLYLIPRYGGYGAALATAISWTMINIVRLIEVKIILGIDPFSRGYWIPGLALVGVFSLCWPVNELILPSMPLLYSRIIIGLIFLSLYGFIFFRFGLKKAERSGLTGFIHRSG